MGERSPPEEFLVGSIAKAKAVKFLNAMTENPFVTFVFVGDEVQVYVKGVSKSIVDSVREALDKAKET